MRAEDTLQFCADFYKSIFPTRKHVLNHLFCVVGNGYDWKDGELVTENDYTKRYRLRRSMKKAEFPNEDEWYRMRNVYLKMNQESGIAIPLDFQFHWYPLSKSYSFLYNIPEDIKPDWQELVDECKQLLIEDGIEI